MAQDISKTRNLITEEPEKFTELKAAMEQWLVESEARFPTTNPKYKP